MKYKKEINLPYKISTHPTKMDFDIAKALKDSGKLSISDRDLKQAAVFREAYLQDTKGTSRLEVSSPTRLARTLAPPGIRIMALPVCVRFDHPLPTRLPPAKSRKKNAAVSASRRRGKRSTAATAGS